MKSKSSHIPPSRLQYEVSHPTITIRVSNELYDQLYDLRCKSGKSLGDILREALGKQAPSVNKAYENGFAAARNEYGVNYKCSVCGGNIIINSEGEKKSAAGFMQERGWGHDDCIRKKYR